MSELTTEESSREREAFEAWYKSKYPDRFGFPKDDWEAWQAARALSAAQPVAQPVVDQKPASMSDNGSCGSQVSGKPVSAEAGKGATWFYRNKTPYGDWQPWAEFKGQDADTIAQFQRFASEHPGLHEARQFYASPSESVAVSAEARSLTERLQLQCSEWGPYWRASDAHGVQLTNAQAIELLQTALGVEVEIVASPPPQPEPTSKGEEPHLPSDGDYLRWAQKEGAKVNWDFEGPNESRVSFANGAQWGRFCDAVRAAYPPSQQREPQEAGKPRFHVRVKNRDCRTFERDFATAEERSEWIDCCKTYDAITNIECWETK